MENMENGPVEIVDFPMKNGGSFHGHSFLYVYQRLTTIIGKSTISMVYGDVQ